MGYINNLSIKESLEKGTEMSSKIIQKLVQDFKLTFLSFKTTLSFFRFNYFGLNFFVSINL
jgi:hypothetical protein